MKSFAIKDVKSTGRMELSEKVPEEALNLGPLDGMNFDRGLDVKLVAQAAGDDLSLTGGADAQPEAVCSRCLARFRSKFHCSINAHFVLSQIQEENLDPVPEIRQAVLLEIPKRMLCRDDCRGLCQRCGANLNNGPCKCSGGRIEQPPTAGPFSDLKNKLGLK